MIMAMLVGAAVLVTSGLILIKVGKEKLAVYVAPFLILAGIGLTWYATYK